MNNWDSMVLEKCCSIIDNIRESGGLWLAGYHQSRGLSFSSKTESPHKAIDLIKEYSHFDEYICAVESCIDERYPIDNLSLCNKVWSDIIQNKRISKSFSNSNIKPLSTIDPKRYAKYKIISKLMARAKNNKNEDEYKYWYSIFDFSDEEHDNFCHQYLLFQQRLMRIIWGYVSGNLKDAYVNGSEALELYKSAMSELFKVRNHHVFKFLHLDYFDSDTLMLQENIKNIDNMKRYIVTTRNDDTLQERALAVELLKLFRDFGNERVVSGVYNFMRAEFIENDIDRKTIQRCFDALPSKFVAK
ncbi:MULTISPECIES: hypothetical protein [Serratia]|uniref:hypothetical protein n=1 Tax=Serratia TaxID=613 RepID=UPI000744FAC8|nr:hypothetical protein [Serratia marcescens]EIM8482259.1 hypothetical protein [Serratia marcescens]EIM8487997.1 hypothetical protein [Serratia marcescens]EIU9512368.1 hypothetical protein [Serratia marcescens]ELE6466017.1 hypothetical protein [Serratia marcescens]CVB83723.1 Uncharacterised protein [Serratia marcescens]